MLEKQHDLSWVNTPLLWTVNAFSGPKSYILYQKTPLVSEHTNVPKIKIIHPAHQIWPAHVFCHGWHGLPDGLFVSPIVLVSGCWRLNSHWHLTTYLHTLPQPQDSQVVQLGNSDHHVASPIVLAYRSMDCLWSDVMITRKLRNTTLTAIC